MGRVSCNYIHVCKYWLAYRQNRVRIARGHIEVLECRSCGFLGTIDLYDVEDNYTQCPACGEVYLAYSQVPIKWYVKQQLQIEMDSKGMEEISLGMWVRKLEVTE